MNDLHNRDQAIHNYLLSLYAKLQPRKLMGYFEDQDKVRGLHSLLYKNQAIHNYLLSLHTKLQPRKLMGYFEDQVKMSGFTSLRG